MARKLRIAAIGSVVVSALVAASLGGAYYAARQVRPFYEAALLVEPAVLEHEGRELESRATTLYTDAQHAGRWQALFTADQINGWLATQLAQNTDFALPSNIRDPRVAILPDVLTLGFRTSSGGIETVLSVDASVSLTDEGAVAIRLISLRAGTLPLPVLQLADELADACEKLRLPVRWTHQEGKPVALLEIHASEPVYVDDIQLGEGQLYVAGHTAGERYNSASFRGARPHVATGGCAAELNACELRLTPKNGKSALEIARRGVQDRGAENASME